MADQYVCLATVPDPNLAQVAAARLRSDGFAVRLHGESLGPFKVTVGALADTQIWVQADDAEAATIVLQDIGIVCTPQDL